MSAAQVVVLAKQPRPGLSKTRLTPPLTPGQAAEVAAAALEDTLDAVRRTDVEARVLVLDGTWPAPGFDVLPQRGGPLDERIAAALDDAWALRPLPLLLVGMDTPQVDEVLLEKAVATLLSPGTDAVLGAAEDGGWWALGLRRPAGHLVRGIATSRDDTGVRQRRALRDGRLAVVDLPVLRDIDTVADLDHVAALVPDSRTAQVRR